MYLLAPFFDRRWQLDIAAGRVQQRMPEGRLPMTFIGGPLFAVSLFW